MSSFADVRALVLQLPEKDRADLAHHLLLSLEPEVLEDDSSLDDWEAEFESRLKKIAEGKHVTHDWREAIADIRRTIHKDAES